MPRVRRHGSGAPRNVFGERLEPFTIFLHDGDGRVSRLADIDVPDGAGFSGVSALSHRTLSAIFKL